MPVIRARVPGALRRQQRRSGVAGGGVDLRADQGAAGPGLDLGPADRDRRARPRHLDLGDRRARLAPRRDRHRHDARHSRAGDRAASSSPGDAMPRSRSRRRDDLVVRTLSRCRTSADNAASVARALVAAEADGLKGHGLSRLPMYAAQAKVRQGRRLRGASRDASSPGADRRSMPATASPIRRSRPRRRCCRTPRAGRALQPPRSIARATAAPRASRSSDWRKPDWSR